MDISVFNMGFESSYICIYVKGSKCLFEIVVEI